MEREIHGLILKLTPERFQTICRCIKDDFDYRYDLCLNYPGEDLTEELDRMEEDLDAIEGLLPSITNEVTADSIKIVIADFKDKIAQVA